MKIYILIPFILSLILSSQCGAQQSISLSEAYEWTRANYPLLKKIDILDKIKSEENDIIAHSRKAIIDLKGETSLQSEAVSIGSGIPNSPININVPLYRVQAFGELNYNLYDGGVINLRKEINDISTLIQQQEIEVNLFPLKEKVNQLFSAVTLAKELLVLYDLTESDLNTRKDIAQSGVDNGVALESDVLKITIRILDLQNEKRKITADINMAYATLSVLTGRKILPEVLLEYPQLSGPMPKSTLDRPELDLFTKQKDALRLQEKGIDIMDKPDLFLFGRAGLAYPNALNFSKVELAPFAIAGVRVAYRLFDKSDQSIKKQKLHLQGELIDVQEATFKHNLEISLAKYEEEFDLLKDQADQYERISQLQAEVLQQMQAQVDNGIITSTEYLLQSTEELRSRQNLKITQVKLVQKILEYHTLIGNNDLLSK
jgi:outer membrane protein TolC